MAVLAKLNQAFLDFKAAAEAAFSDAKKVRSSAPGTQLSDGSTLAEGGVVEAGAAAVSSVEGARDSGVATVNSTRDAAVTTVEGARDQALGQIAPQVQAAADSATAAGLSATAAGTSAGLALDRLRAQRLYADVAAPESALHAALDAALVSLSLDPQYRTAGHEYSVTRLENGPASGGEGWKLVVRNETTGSNHATWTAGARPDDGALVELLGVGGAVYGRAVLRLGAVAEGTFATAAVPLAAEHVFGGPGRTPEGAVLEATVGANAAAISGLDGEIEPYRAQPAGQPTAGNPDPRFENTTAGDVTTGTLSPGNPFGPGQTILLNPHGYVDVRWEDLDFAVTPGTTVVTILYGIQADGTTSGYRARAISYADAGGGSIGPVATGYAPVAAADTPEVRRLGSGTIAGAAGAPFTVPAGSDYCRIGFQRDNAGTDNGEMLWVTIHEGDVDPEQNPPTDPVASGIDRIGDAEATLATLQQTGASVPSGYILVAAGESQSNGARVGQPTAEGAVAPEPIPGWNYILSATDPTVHDPAAQLVAFDDGLLPETNAGGPDGRSLLPGFVEYCNRVLRLGVVVVFNAKPNTSLLLEADNGAGNWAPYDATTNPGSLKEVLRQKAVLADSLVQAAGLNVVGRVMLRLQGAADAGYLDDLLDDATNPGKTAQERQDEFDAALAAWEAALDDSIRTYWPSVLPGGPWHFVVVTTVTPANEDRDDPNDKPGWKAIRTAQFESRKTVPFVEFGGDPFAYDGPLGYFVGGDNVHPPDWRQDYNGRQLAERVGTLVSAGTAA